MKRLKLMTWLVLVVLAERVSAKPELIFKVPEVRHAAVPRPVGTRPPDAANASADELHSQPPTQYYTEHEVSIEDARKEARTIQIYQIPDSLPGCGACSAWEVEYCAGAVLEDHCCCERRYMREPFPWLPHSCYLQTARCELRAHNCAHYTRLRDCCCNKRLADKWKTILSKATHLSLSGMVVLLFGMVLFSLYI